MAEQFENRYDQLDQKKSFEQDHNVTEVGERAWDISKKNPDEFVRSVKSELEKFLNKKKIWKSPEDIGLIADNTMSEEGARALEEAEKKVQKNLNPVESAEKTPPLA